MTDGTLLFSVMNYGVVEWVTWYFEDFEVIWACGKNATWGVNKESVWQYDQRDWCGRKTICDIRKWHEKVLETLKWGNNAWNGVYVEGMLQQGWVETLAMATTLMRALRRNKHMRCSWASTNKLYLTKVFSVSVIAFC